MVSIEVEGSPTYVKQSIGLHEAICLTDSLYSRQVTV